MVWANPADCTLPIMQPAAFNWHLCFVSSPQNLKILDSPFNSFSIQLWKALCGATEDITTVISSPVTSNISWLSLPTCPMDKDYSMLLKLLEKVCKRTLDWDFTFRDWKQTFTMNESCPESDLDDAFAVATAHSVLILSYSTWFHILTSRQWLIFLSSCVAPLQQLMVYLLAI